MSHPSHKKQLPSLKRIEGQIRGISKMIEEDRYCIDILNQIKAVRNALSTVEGKVLKSHLRSCIKAALKDDKHLDIKVEELINTLKR